MPASEERRRIGLAVEQGDAHAQALLGGMHFAGEGEAQDFTEARRLYGLAAEQGHPDALAAVGSMHVHGQGGPKDLAEARRLYGLAAAQGEAAVQTALGMMHYNSEGGPPDLAEARRLLGLAAAQGQVGVQAMLGSMHRDGKGGPRDLAEARRLCELAAGQGHGKMHYLGDALCVVDALSTSEDLAEARRVLTLAAAQGQVGARAELDALDRLAKVQRAKQQADADAMMEQLLAEDLEEKKAKLFKGAAESAKSDKTKKSRKKRGEPATISVGTDHALEARDAGVETGVKDSGETQSVLVPVAPSPSTEPAAVHALEPVLPLIGARAAAPVPVALGASGRGRGRGLNGRGRGRGGQWMQSSTAIATGDDAVGAKAHLLVGQASLQVPADSSNAGATAVVATAAPAALDRPPPPPPAAVMSLADAQFNTGRPEAPESTIGGQSTCIICFSNPKSHLAAPCGHQCACGACSAQMKDCPICRTPVQTWIHVRVA